MFSYKVMAADSGFFGYQQVMDDFYNYEPDEDDSEGRAIKRNFQANMVQSGFDSALAESMAQTQSGIAQQNMTHAADLEQRNTAANMQQEFNYGQQSMASQFELQDKFADNQSERDIVALGAQTEAQRSLYNSKGLQDRYTAIEQGNQNRQLADVQGGYQVQQQNIAADASKYGADATKDASKYQSDASVTNTQTQAASQDRATDAQERSTDKQTAAQERASNYGADKTFDASKLQTEASVTNTNTQAASQDRATDAQERSTDKQTAASITNTQTTADANKYGADKAAQASMYGADATKEASIYQSDTSTRNITETGKQQRETMGYQDNLDAKKASRQSARSRSMARAF